MCRADEGGKKEGYNILQAAHNQRRDQMYRYSTQKKALQHVHLGIDCGIHPFLDPVIIQINSDFFIIVDKF